MSEQQKIESIERCPKCGTKKVRQSSRRGVLEYLMSLLGVYPYDCTHYTCQHRFYWRGSRSLSQSSVRSLDRSALNNLYDPLKKEPYKQQLPSDRQLDPVPGSLQPQLKSSDTEYHTLPQFPAHDTQNQDSQPVTNDPSRYDFLPSSQLQPRKILTLNWSENGEPKQQLIYSQNDKGVAGRVKLGRNPDLCDVVFKDLTVSGVNAEIYFDRQLQDFYLSNLRASNPPFIDRQKAISTMALASGMVLYLGRVPITIEIEIDYAQIESTGGFDRPTHLFEREERLA